MARVIVSVAADRIADLPTVVDALRRAGLTVAEVLDGAGVVTGEASGEVIAALAKVPGVADVETERDVRLPPPDSPVQ
ncbi:hypothetical protein BLA60_09750 [Actinophytocola xinjiangensis]|uniref:Ketohydroxyglutarate aldolase n=1 Tax=Actinophytocola xinjiangensis TaxID=485602 RepID=A0A7Z0WPG1_9PSEU|nr:hypothetical protein [Actinophytocola xinjiangensis]OLF12260.1 hypothetical protein BLA60_09750 [Actinophytocola xinjiangensis]